MHEWHHMWKLALPYWGKPNSIISPPLTSGTVLQSRTEKYSFSILAKTLYISVELKAELLESCYRFFLLHHLYRLVLKKSGKNSQIWADVYSNPLYHPSSRSLILKGFPNSGDNWVRGTPRIGHLSITGPHRGTPDKQPHAHTHTNTHLGTI